MLCRQHTMYSERALEKFAEPVEHVCNMKPMRTVSTDGDSESEEKETCSLSKLTEIVIHFKLTRKSRDFSNISFCRHHVVLEVATLHSHRCTSFNGIVLLLKWLQKSTHSMKFNNKHQHVNYLRSISVCVCLRRYEMSA